TMLASSSMSRILGCDFICIFLSARQDNAKGRAAIDLGLILECAAMLFNNARRNRQAQPGARVFGGKERVEKPLLNFQGDTLAGVNHLQNDCRRGATRLRSEATSRQARQGRQAASRTQCNRSVPANTFRRVLNQV